MEIENLIYESESNALDFKSEQYKFVGANDIEKAELLKDIIAFSNSWKRINGYILIGVKEIKGEPSEIIGVEESIDDAQLQQFINSKMNKPIDFSYKELILEEKRIGIIEIPTQERPFYLIKKYGNLNPNTVYIRRGSSTSIAKPDEIAKMNLNIIEEKIMFDLFLYNPLNEQIIGEECNYSGVSRIIENEESIPDYSNLKKLETNISRIINQSLRINKDYYRDFASYYKYSNSTFAICLYLRNNSKKSIYKIKGQASLPFNDSWFFGTKYKKPKKINDIDNGGPVFPYIPKKPRYNISFEDDYIHDKYILNWWSEDIFPGETIIFDQILLTFNDSYKLEFIFDIVGENISEPLRKILTIEVDLKKEIVVAEDLISIADKT